MLKVAVVDGNAISRNLLTTIFINGGYDVVQETNLTPAGLASVVKCQPQVVCIDIGEANLQGMEALDTIRAGLPKTLMFMVSGKIDTSTVQNAIERGVRGFIVKPFNPATVLSTIRNTIIKVAKEHRAKAADAAPG